jgi:multiple sugar transport system substrate-binding protein
MQDLQAGKIGRREFIVRALALGVSLSGIEALLQSCGGGGSAKPGATTITWTTWGNPGELQRFQQVTSKFNSDHPNINLQLIPIPSTADYEAKILTQLTSHTAPDVFYVFDSTVGKLIQNKTIVELTPLLTGPKSQSKPDQYFEGLWGPAKTADGKIYGIMPDCNPIVLWCNKKVLQDSGVTQMPADLYTQGKWNRDAFQSIIEQVHSKGKYGYILDDWSLIWYSWVTSSGGTVYDKNGYGKFVAHEDPKAVETFQWLLNNVKAKNIIFAGTLPKGQGTDLSFMANEAAFVSAGRWYLPEFKQVSGLEYDIAPFPPNTGKRIAPTGAGMAYVVINAATKHMDQAFEFLTYFVSPAGQIFRISGGGNAVPSLKAGADQVVLQGNNPAHAQIFLDARSVCYTLPPAEAWVPGLSLDIQTQLDAIWFKGANVQATLNKAGSMANSRISTS